MMFWTLVGLGIANLGVPIGLHVSRMRSDRAFRTDMRSRFESFETCVREDIKGIRKEIKDMREEMSDDRKAVLERLEALKHPVST